MMALSSSLEEDIQLNKVLLQDSRKKTNFTATHYQQYLRSEVAKLAELDLISEATNWTPGKILLF